MKKTTTTFLVKMVYIPLKELKPKQKEVLEKFVGGKDIFVSLPTGSGKSLCYWILPLVYNHLQETSNSIVLVVSPLVALMRDQVSSLQERLFMLEIPILIA